MKTKIFTKALLLGAAVCLSAIVNAQGLKWAKQFNSDGTGSGLNNGGACANGLDAGYAVTTDASGNVYATGIADQTCSTSDNSIEVIKYNSAGTVQWKYNINGGYNSGSGDRENGYAIGVDGSGNVWVAASYYNGSTYHQDLALFKFNSSGTLQSGYPKTENDASGNENVVGSCLYVYDATHVYIGGSTYDGTTWKGIVHKDNSSGSGWSWNYTFNGSSSGVYTSAVQDIKADANYVYITGYESNSSQGEDVFTAKLLASTGAIQSGWPVTYNNSSNNLDDAAIAMAVDGTSNVIVAGFSTNSTQGRNALLIKYTSSGSTATGFPIIYNNSTYNKDEEFVDIAVCCSGSAATHIYVGGFMQKYTGPTTYDEDYLLTDYNSTGGINWGPVFYDGSKSAPELQGTDEGWAIDYEPSTSRIYISGRSSESNTNINITTLGYSGTTGSLVWGAYTYDYGSDAIVGKDQMYWKYGLTTSYNSLYCVDEIFVEGDSYIDHSGNQNFDYQTLKYSCIVCNVCGAPSPRLTEQSSEKDFQEELYPNPFSESAVLKTATSGNAELRIYDLFGREVKPDVLRNGDLFQIQRSGLASGVYIYKVSESGNLQSAGKFVIAE